MQQHDTLELNSHSACKYQNESLHVDLFFGNFQVSAPVCLYLMSSTCEAACACVASSCGNFIVAAKVACVLVVVVVVGSVGTAGQEATVSRGVGDVITISSPDGVCVNVSCGDYKTYIVEEDVCREDTDLQSKELEMVITASSIILFFIFI